MLFQYVNTGSNSIGTSPEETIPDVIPTLVLYKSYTCLANNKDILQADMEVNPSSPCNMNTCYKPRNPKPKQMSSFLFIAPVRICRGKSPANLLV